jgi:hypothetical protein
MNAVRSQHLFGSRHHAWHDSEVLD